MRCRVLLCTVLLGVAVGVQAQVEVEKPPIALDPSEELRFETMLPNLRCLVCQNESLADSQAPLAVDLRYDIRGLLAAGRSDEEVRHYLTDRYGEFVLYRPQFTVRNALLWLGPLLLALAGVGMLVQYSRRMRRVAAPPESPDAEALQKLLGRPGDGSTE